MRGNIDTRYVRPVPCSRALPGAWSLGGTATGFREVEILARGRAPEVLPMEAAIAIYPESRAALTRASAPRAPVAGLRLERAQVMGVVNVTPDSFSDGGRFRQTAAAVAHGLALVEAGAAILDIGGESTRPGADPVAPQDEADRVLPVIEGLIAAGCTAPISVDTRNASTARAALSAGAQIVNDVSALTHDPQMAEAATGAQATCLMHARGDPKTMQQDPSYDDVLLDVFDWLEARVATAAAAGIQRERLVIDPGIGFGKTLEHNLALIRRLSLFHGLGCALLLGVSRKRFIGTLSGVAQAPDRMAGSLAAGLAGVHQGAHILRVHDVDETVQALKVWQALDEIPEGAP